MGGGQKRLNNEGIYPILRLRSPYHAGATEKYKTCLGGRVNFSGEPILII